MEKLDDPAERLLPTVAWDGPSEAVVGLEFQCALEVTTPEDCEVNTVVTALLPDGLCFTSAEGGGRYDASRRQVSWDLTPLAPGRTCRLAMRVLAESVTSASLTAEARCGAAVSLNAVWHIVIRPQQAALSLEGLLAQAEQAFAPMATRQELRRQTAPPRPLRHQNNDEEGDRYLLITLAGKEYALPATGVVEVNQPQLISRVPNVPDWLLGLTNVRGDVVSVVDLCAFLGLGAGEKGPHARMVAVRTLSGDLSTIFLVDRVRSIRRLSVGDRGKDSTLASPGLAAFVAAVREYNGELLIALDLERLLQSTELRELAPT